MNYPPTGLVVKILLDDSSEVFGYWDGDKWMRGAEFDPVDYVIEQDVISWEHYY